MKTSKNTLSANKTMPAGKNKTPSKIKENKASKEFLSRLCFEVPSRVELLYTVLQTVT